VEDLAGVVERRQHADRPLGIARRPGEVDRTPLLTYEAFSKSIARERLAALCRLGLLTKDRRDELTGTLQGSFDGAHTCAGQNRSALPLEDWSDLAAPAPNGYLRAVQALKKPYYNKNSFPLLDGQSDLVPDQIEWALARIPVVKHLKLYNDGAGMFEPKSKIEKFVPDPELNK
jgi:hypothetical protein